MFRYHTMRTKFYRALQTLQGEGVRALVAHVRRRAYMWRECYASRGVKNVILDGCTFTLETMPNNAMRVSLLKMKYERFERWAVLQYLRPEYPVVELGGCIGVVACVTNRTMRCPEEHVVVEANPNVISILQKNRDINHCKFQILNRAVAYDEPSTTFSPASDFRGSTLRQQTSQPFENPSVTVATTTLGSIVAQRGFSRFNLICDIEGQESELVKRESHVFEKVDTLIMETHARMIGEEKNGEMLKKLADLGFQIVDQDSVVLVMRRDAGSSSNNEGEFSSIPAAKIASRAPEQGRQLRCANAERSLGS